MDKIDKQRGKYVSTHANSVIAKYRNPGDNDIDNCRKCRQSNDASMTHDRNERRQSNPPIDTGNYYCSTESYRPRKHHGVSGASRAKYLVPSVPEESYRADNKNYGSLKALRSQFYPNNVAIVRKNHYKDDADDEEESKYVDDDLELTGDDNAEEENREEVADENCDNTSEFNDKEYDQQDVDDEVDEESDVLERQIDRLKIQKKTRTEPVTRGHQRINAAEPSQHHRGHKTLQGKAPARCCHTATDRDATDIPTDDEDEEQDIREPEPFPSRKSTWRCPTSQQDREAWNPSRNLLERYADLNRNEKRRPRTTRPEAEASIRSAQIETVRHRKCNRCAASSGHPPKTTSSRNATCRLQDSRYFIREQNGDEGEAFEEPEPPMIYQTKSRKSKELRSPIYDPREDARTLDAEIGAIYKSCRSKNSRESSNGHRERTKHSFRTGNRHDSSSAALKHENHYWPQ